MDSEKMTVTRRDFIFASAIVVSSPMFPYLPMFSAGEAKAAEVAAAVAEKPFDHDHSKCNGCQVCTILYSDCLAVNNRVCWCGTNMGGSDNDR
jgi:hypothetical protein